MNSFDEFAEAMSQGMLGKNDGIPMGYPRLNRHIGIQKSMYFLIGGLTGSGKTSFVDDTFILNAYDWSISKKNINNLKLSIIYRSMERNRLYKIAKWTARKIFLDVGVIVSISKLLGWAGQRLTSDEHDLALSCRDYIEGLEECVTIISGPENPVGIAKELRAYALQNGHIEDLNEFNKIYIPNDPTKITEVVIDTMNLLKLTKELNTKKLVIDKMSNELQYTRDFFGFTPVAVSQFNRMIANPTRLKNNDVEPNLEDFKESGQSQDDADIVLTLFDPMRYKVTDPSGYDLDKLTDENGAKYFRSLRVIKNSYGNDDLRLGLAFFGEIGKFKELSKRKDITDAEYEAVRNKSFFLDNN